MLSLIEVTCPHCAAKGQIMLPPLGSIIVGPCPECQGMVVVFCGRVLALDKEIMMEGGVEQKKEHLLEVLGVFLHQRVEKLFDEKEQDGGADIVSDEAHPGPHEQSGPEPLREPEQAQKKPELVITEQEFDNFRRVDLEMIDNPDYFKAIFG